VQGEVMRKLIVAILMVFISGCSSPPAKFKIGDVVCLKDLNSKGVIKAVVYHKWIGYYYKVIFDGGNQVTFLPKQHRLIGACNNAKQ